MKNLKGTKTEANLIAAFEIESKTRNQYDFYANTAKKEGYDQIAASLGEISQNGTEYAKRWLELLFSDDVPNAAAGLKDCIKNEQHKRLDLYSRMAEEAREDGLPEIASLFQEAAEINKVHENICRKLIQMINKRNRNTAAVQPDKKT